jgi:hypothetical protein
VSAHGALGGPTRDSRTLLARILPVAVPTKLGMTGVEMDHTTLHMRTFFDLCPAGGTKRPTMTCDLRRFFRPLPQGELL